MGTKLDAKRREDTCEDTIRRQDKVELTRRWIYEKGVSVNSSWVERVLKPKSWVPTRVNLTCNGNPFQIDLPMIECIFNTTVNIWFQLLLNVCP
jgi:hypothetical protein